MALSLSQQQIWLDQLSHPDSPHFNIGGTGIINGAIDVPLMQSALQQLVTQQSALRLLPLADASLQLINDWQQPLLDYVDHSDKHDADGFIYAALQTIFAQPIYLDGKQRPWCFVLMRASEKRYCIMAKFHHLVMDGYSVALAFRHFSAIYNQLLDSQEAVQSPSINTPRSAYQTFISDSNNYVGSTQWQADKQYWHKVLPQLPSRLLEKTHEHQATSQLPLAHHHFYHIPASQYQQFQLLAKGQNATAYHLYLAALAIYFCRIYHKKCLILGVPVLNRSGKRYKLTLGMYAVMVPLKIDVHPGITINELVVAISKSLRNIYRHARYPLSALAGDLNMLAHGQDRLFDIILSFEKQDFTVNFGDAPLHKVKQLFTQAARYPLTISVCEFHDEDPVEIAIESSAAYFTLEQTQLLASRLHNMMLSMIGQSTASIDTLPLLLSQERHALIDNQGFKQRQVNQAPTVICAFEDQAALRPWAIALRTLTSEINYKTLNEQANQLARRLIALGVQENDVVVVIAPRQVCTITAFLAIAKAGAAFAPLDPAAPEDRLMQLISLSGAVIALLDKSSLSLQQRLSVPCLQIDNAPVLAAKLSVANLKRLISPKQLAYLLFTSGSTGTPKGVLIEHGALALRIRWLANAFDYSHNDVALQSIALTFDPSMIEIFLPLSQGATLALAPAGQLAPTDIAQYAEQLRVTSIIFVPTTMRYFNQNAKNYRQLKLRIAISGGEILRRDQALSFIKQTGAQLYNLYGPTEACIFASAYRFDAKISPDPVPIGKPVDDSCIYVLSSQRQPLPSGVVGEIFIGGHGLARGYLNNPEANQRFIPDPFVANARLYQTGDSGYWDEQGQLHFVGRIDNQIKLHGQRVEPGEIETALCTLVWVAEAGVKKVNNELHAWLVLNKTLDALMIGQIKQGLGSLLPHYMIPSYFTQIAHMPRQSSGKTDHSALHPKPVSSNSENTSIDDTTQYSNLHKLLLNLWQQSLPSKKLTYNCNFFNVGGDSLSALILLSHIDKQLGQRLPLSLLLQNPTVNTLATAMMARHQPLLVDLSKNKVEKRIYLAASGHGDALRFMPLVKALAGNASLHMLQPPINRGYTSYQTIGQLAELYAGLIAQQPQKTPPTIVGFSIGGISALETARRLTARGVPIKGLILIDTSYPRWILRRPVWRWCAALVKTLHLQELSINQRTLGALFSDPGLNGQLSALRQYKPSALSVPATLIISSGFNTWYRLLFKPWKKIFTQQLTQKQLPGFHGSLFSSKHVDAVAEQILKTANSHHNSEKKY